MPRPKGYKHTEVSKMKMSEMAKKRKYPLLQGFQKGQKFTEEHRRKISENSKKRTGSRAANWQGGISKDKEYIKKWMKEYYHKKPTKKLHNQRRISLEHKIPLSRNGTNEYNNLAIAHRSCNCKKHNKTEGEFKICKK